MPRPFRLFSTPATRDKGNSEIKSATTTTTGKHVIWPSTSIRGREKRLEKIQRERETCDKSTLLWHLSGLEILLLHFLFVYALVLYCNIHFTYILIYLLYVLVLLNGHRSMQMELFYLVCFVLGEGSSHQLIVKRDCCSAEVRDRAKTHVLLSQSGAIGFRFCLNRKSAVMVTSLYFDHSRGSIHPQNIPWDIFSVLSF